MKLLVQAAAWAAAGGGERGFCEVFGGVEGDWEGSRGKIWKFRTSQVGGARARGAVAGRNGLGFRRRYVNGPSWFCGCLYQGKTLYLT